MGRHKSSAVFAHFEYNLEDRTSKCLVPGCKSQLQAKHAGNLKSHLRSFHPDIFKKVEDLDSKGSSLKRKQPDLTPDVDAPVSSKSRQQKLEDKFLTLVPKSIKINMDAATVLRGSVQLVTQNGRPFSIIDDTGFKTLMSSILQSLNINLNRRTVVDEMLKTFQEEKLKLVAALKGKQIFLKIDMATRLERHFLGINVQFYDDQGINLKTLSVVEIKDGDTRSEAIKTHVEECLQSFKIDPAQILSITSDNGSNMLKTVRLLNEMLEEQEAEEANSEASDDVEVKSGQEEYDGAESDDGVDDVNEETNQRPMEHESSETQDSVVCVTLSNIVSTRCAAHTLELAVMDALKIAGVKINLQRARRVIKKLRTPSLIPMVLNRFGKKPILDTVTRWGSSFDMVESFLSMKDAVIEWGTANAELRITQQCWDNLELVKSVLEPVRRASLALQSENMTPGDFYKIWTKAKLDVQKNTESRFAEALVDRMAFREKLLFDQNPLMMAAIYLDPRFGATLSPEQQTEARETIIAVFNRSAQGSSQEAIIAAESSDNGSEDEFEAFLKEKERNRESPRTQVGRSPLIEALDLYAKLPREKEKQNAKFDVFQWWQVHGPSALKDVARTISCLPATQVSVERLFSALAYILSDRRSRIKDAVLNALLYLRCNGF